MEDDEFRGRLHCDGGERREKEARELERGETTGIRYQLSSI